jgi:hypothetical protein
MAQAVICQHLTTENQVRASVHYTRDSWWVNWNRYFFVRTFHLPVSFHPRSILIFVFNLLSFQRQVGETCEHSWTEKQFIFIEASRLTALFKLGLYCDRVIGELVQTFGDVSSKQMEKYSINNLNAA